jgi:TRAP-type C4-dicarboxylate transport system substrate-binding protein
LGWAAAAQAEQAVTLRIVGGLEGVSQYTRHELPFWRDRLPILTQGAFKAEIVPFDRAGLRAQEMTRLLRLGVVPFGHVLAGTASADEPLLGAFDIPLDNPSIEALRVNLAARRPFIEADLRERLGIELLAVFTYPAQVIFCREPISGLGDLAGRRVRASGVAQTELMMALKAQPAIIPFADMRAALRNGRVDCAITGTLSGYEVGLAGAATQVLVEPVTWGVSFFAANRRAWMAIAEGHRAAIRQGLAELEAEIWRAAAADTALGIACLGRGPCPHGEPGGIRIVMPPSEDALRREGLLRDVVLPQWVSRCGASCAELLQRTPHASR